MMPYENSIQWVQSVHEDGFVFVCRGEPDDLDEYAMRKDLTWGDDTEQMLSVMRAKQKELMQ